MKPLLVLLLLVFLPASGQLLSDQTGLVSTLDVESGGRSFEVRVVGNFDVSGHEFDAGSNRLLVLVDSSLERNIGEIILPMDLLGGNLTFYLNGEELEAKVSANEQISFVTLNFEGSGSNELEIYGTVYSGGNTSEPVTFDYWWVIPGVVAAAAAALAVRKWTAQK
ncbi:MAG: hypothetical protein EB829_07015 [Nitrosopumilus sp. H8]|nr:MAG: hypothetical protein EB829_07015 [Nitrosopumilus sp. H8]